MSAFHGIFLSPEHLLLLDIGIAERVLLPIVQFYARNEGRCWASNQYLGQLMGVTPIEISRRIKSLVRAGYLESEVIGHREGKGGLRRYLRPTDRCPALPESRKPESETVEQNGHLNHPVNNDLNQPVNNPPPVKNPINHPVKNLLYHPVNRVLNHPVKTYKDDVKSPDVKSPDVKSRQAVGTYTVQGCKASGCSTAVNTNEGSDAGKDPMVRSTPRAPEVRTPHAREALPPLSEGAALLLKPVTEGGAGFDCRKAAERIARARSPEELRHWIRLAKVRRAHSIAAFIYGCVSKGRAPPESYLRAEKEAYREAMSGGILAGLTPRGITLPTAIRQVSGPPPGWRDEDDERDEDEAPPRTTHVPRSGSVMRPNAGAYEVWRGHR